jgi:hypothetical protein
MQPVDTLAGGGFAVTLADSQGQTATLMLEARDLRTYQAFQAAVRRETGASFRYRPAGQPELLDAV